MHRRTLLTTAAAAIFVGATPAFADKLSLNAISQYLNRIQVAQTDFTQVNDDGTLSVDRSGGLHTWKIGETAVEIVGDGDSLTGILSYGSTHTAGMT